VQPALALASHTTLGLTRKGANVDLEKAKAIAAIVQAAAAVSLPVVAALVGLKLNRHLEATKVMLLRDKDWRFKWADGFFTAATRFDASAGECACLLFEFGDLAKKRDPATTKAMADVEDSLRAQLSILRRQEWELSVQLQFAPNGQHAVVQSTQGVISEFFSMINQKHGSFEKVRGYLKDFNDACKLAHREMLEP
jgi:hypothetical protein